MYAEVVDGINLIWDNKFTEAEKIFNTQSSSHPRFALHYAEVLYHLLLISSRIFLIVCHSLIFLSYNPSNIFLCRLFRRSSITILFLLSFHPIFVRCRREYSFLFVVSVHLHANGTISFILSFIKFEPTRLHFCAHSSQLTAPTQIQQSPG